MNTIKNTIKESGRYEYIKQLVLDLALSETNLPIRIRLDKGKAISYVKPDGIREGIRIWEKYLDTDGRSISNEEALSLFEFSARVEDEVDTRLHNYANSCAHRNVPEESVLEDIRAWEILYSSISYLEYNNELDCDFSVPDGWKMQREERV